MNLSLEMPLLYVIAASFFTATMAIIAATTTRSLPLRHMILKSSLLVSLISPLPFLVGVWGDFGCFPILHRTAAASDIDKELTVPAVVRSDSLNPPLDDRNAFKQESIHASEEVDRIPTSILSVSQPLTAPEIQLNPITRKPTLPTAVILSLLWFLGSTIYFLKTTKSWFKHCKLISNIDAIVKHDLELEIGLIADELELERAPNTLIVPGIAGPYIFGWRKPKLLVPESFCDSFTPKARRQILTHELAHLKRGDYRTLAIQVVALGAFWWNPLVRIVSDRLAITREMLCDDIAIELNGGWDQYAQSMIAMAEQFVSHQPQGVALAMAAGDFETRLKRVLDLEGCVPATSAKPHSIFTISVATVLLFASLAFAQFPQKSESTHSDETHQTVAATHALQEEPRNQKDPDPSESDNFAEPQIQTQSAKSELPTFNLKGFPTKKYRVIVRDRQNNPVENAKIEILNSHNSLGFLLTNFDGAADFNGPQEQVFFTYVKATTEDGTTGAVSPLGRSKKETDSEFNIVNLQLEPLVRRSIKVTASSGEPLADSNVVVGFARPLFSYR